MFAILVAAAILALNLYAPADPTALQRLMGSLLLGLCSLPTLMWVSDRDWGHSLMPITGIAYGLWFGSPVFLRQEFYGQWLGSPRIDDSLIEWTLLLALVGWTLLLVGYFGPHRRWLTCKTPRFEVIPSEMQRYTAALAVVIGIAAAPFFYLHIGELVAFYTGSNSLPSGAAFPVELAGQFVVLSILILFYLQFRGQLGLAGKSFMWLLVAYYTVLGLSGGLILHGMSAILALFVAWVATAPTPTWRGAVYGVLAAAILFFVLMPLRPEFRALIWTHGVDASAGQAQRESIHTFTLPSDTGVKTSVPVVETSGYDVFYGNGVLTYYHKEAGVCDAESADNAKLHFFLHIIPVDKASLPISRTSLGFDNFDFPLDKGGVVSDGQCVHHAPLPSYAIDSIRTGLYTRVDASAGQAQRESIHTFTLPSDTGVETSVPVVETSGYDVFYGNGVLTYYHKEAGVCDAESTDNAKLHFFLHIIPVDKASLPISRTSLGFDNFDFPLDKGGVVSDGQCVHHAPLPSYAIDSIRTGLYTRVDASAGQAQRESIHTFTLPSDTGVKTSVPVVETSGYDVFYGNGVLTYYHKEAGVCDAESADNAKLHFFLHIIPVDKASLPISRTSLGFDNFDFPLDKGGVVSDGQCVHHAPLPSYAIDSIRTGLYTRGTADGSGLRRREGPPSWESKMLTTFVGGSYRNINSDEQWLLNTVDATSWELDTETEGAGKRRLHIYETHEAELNALATVQQGDLIRVEVDADNWAEYMVNQTLVIDGFRVIYRLRALLDHKGDRSALREGGAQATFIYPSWGESFTPQVTAWTETRDSPGRNPHAPSAGESQLGKAAIYVQVFWNHVASGRASPRRFQSLLDAAAIRLDMLLPVSWVVHQTPDTVPYLRGDTYYPALFKFVPRLIWEGKPKELSGLEQRYGFLPEDNEINGFKVTQLGEMYMNFGALGILLGMLLLGVLYRVLYQLFFHDRASVVTMAAGAHIMTILIVNMESSTATSASVGYILWYVVLLALLGVAARIALRAKRSIMGTERGETNDTEKPGAAL